MNTCFFICETHLIVKTRAIPQCCQKSLFHICYGHSFSVAISHPLQSVIHNICSRGRIPFFVTKSGKWKHCKGEFVNELKCDISNEKYFKWCLMSFDCDRSEMFAPHSLLTQIGSRALIALKPQRSTQICVRYRLPKPQFSNLKRP